MIDYNYREQVIVQLSKELGKGFSERTLRDYRRFYLLFPDQDNLAHMCAKLTWSHIRLTMRVESDTEELATEIEREKQILRL